MYDTQGLYALYLGKQEGFGDKLRSVIAQFHYAHEIRKFKGQGILFNVHMYVPEHHPVTNEIFFEREDDAHLIKVCIFRRIHRVNGIFYSVLLAILELEDQQI